MARPTQIGGGVQHHHQHNLNGASLGVIGAAQWLKGVVEITGRPEHDALLEDTLALCRRIGDAHREAQARLSAHYDADPELFYRCRMGIAPWPDELSEGFEPICTCDHRCLFHDTEAPGATEERDCNCDAVCPRHGFAREYGDREPLLPLPTPDY